MNQMLKHMYLETHGVEIAVDRARGLRFTLVDDAGDEDPHGWSAAVERFNRSRGMAFSSEPPSDTRFHLHYLNPTNLMAPVDLYTDDLRAAIGKVIAERGRFHRVAISFMRGDRSRSAFDGLAGDVPIDRLNELYGVWVDRLRKAEAEKVERAIARL